MITVGFTLDHTHPSGSTPQVSQDRAYVTAIAASGAVPIPIPPLADDASLRHLYDLCDALVLPGGWDVAPGLYGADVDPTTRPIDPAVEDAEVRLLRWGLADDKPMLLICRGMQLLNAICGGTLHQDIAQDEVTHKPADMTALVHSISLTAGSIIARAANGVGEVMVNSQHHQSIDRLADGLVVTARADDGVIEAVDVPGYRYLTGVQFHPEVMAASVPWAAELFAQLVAAAMSSTDEIAS